MFLFSSPAGNLDVDCHSANMPDSGSMGFQLKSCCDLCFNLLLALGKLQLATNVQPLNPGDEWVPGLGHLIYHPIHLKELLWLPLVV